MARGGSCARLWPGRNVEWTRSSQDPGSEGGRRAGGGVRGVGGTQGSLLSGRLGSRLSAWLQPSHRLLRGHCLLSGVFTGDSWHTPATVGKKTVHCGAARSRDTGGEQAPLSLQASVSPLCHERPGLAWALWCVWLGRKKIKQTQKVT